MSSPSPGYARRLIDDDLDELFPRLPAILLDGPKGVGKTTTALQRCSNARYLDEPAQNAIVAADPTIIAANERPLLLDEWTRVPAVWDAVRRLVDADGAGGQFLLTGSAPTGETHSGAGRITTMRMRPLSLYERSVHPATVSFGSLLAGTRAVGGHSTLRLADYVREITAGGFPGMRHLEGRALEVQLDSYIDRIVDHDLLEAGSPGRRPATVRAWMRAYAAATATTASWEKIRDASSPGDDDKPATRTLLPYIELLTYLHILDPIEAWTPSHNHLDRLTAASKHHLADPALAARLVTLGASQLTSGREPDRLIPRDGTYLGGLFESLAALSIRTLAQRHDSRVFHLRTQGGRHEVDFIVEGREGILAFEAKLAGAIDESDVKNLRWLRDRLGDRCIDTVVLTTGPEAYRRPDGIAVVPLALLGP